MEVGRFGQQELEAAMASHPHSESEKKARTHTNTQFLVSVLYKPGSPARAAVLHTVKMALPMPVNITVVMLHNSRFCQADN